MALLLRPALCNEGPLSPAHLTQSSWSSANAVALDLMDLDLDNDAACCCAVAFRSTSTSGVYVTRTSSSGGLGTAADPGAAAASCGFGQQSPKRMCCSWSGTPVAVPQPLQACSGSAPCLLTAATPPPQQEDEQQPYMPRQRLPAAMLNTLVPQQLAEPEPILAADHAAVLASSPVIALASALRAAAALSLPCKPGALLRLLRQAKPPLPQYERAGGGGAAAQPMEVDAAQQPHQHRHRHQQHAQARQGRRSVPSGQQQQQQAGSSSSSSSSGSSGSCRQPSCVSLTRKRQPLDAPSAEGL